jgi:hypothetical protein
MRCWPTNRIARRRAAPCDGLVVEMLDQGIGLAPGVGRALAHDDMETDAEAELAAARGCQLAHFLDLGPDIGRRLAPGQIDIDMVGRDLLARAGGAAEIEWGVGRLPRRVEQLAAFDSEMLALVIDGLALNQPQISRNSEVTA